jgi:Zn-dependent protease
LESQQVTLLSHGQRVGSGARVVPNPVMDGGKAVLSFLPSIGSTAQAQVYSLAGERVLIVSGPSIAGSLTLDTSRLGPGIYVVEFTKVQNGAVLTRTLIKMAVIR